MKREYKLLLAVFILALIIRIVFIFSSPVKIWDETVYANLGYDLSKTPLDYSFANNGWSDFIPITEGKYSWPNAGFRAPLLPYFLSIFYFLKLDFLINFLIPLVGALSIVLVYSLGKRLFNEKIALYSAIFLALVPIHVVYSAKILTDVFFTFFVLLTFLSFWRGYEEGNNKYKLLFGFFLALTLLSRYTALWIIPAFLIYFLIRDKSLRFLKDGHILCSAGIFFLTLIPWFIYGFFEYGSIFGAFIHGMKASAYWGGTRPWYFFFQYWPIMFSIIGIFLVFALVYIIYKKEFIKREIYLLLIWLGFFLGMAMIMPHKEDRFILAITPAIALISGYFMDEIKKYKKLIFIAIILLLIFSLSLNFFINYKDSYTGANSCFLEGNEFLKNAEKDAVIITDESSIVYYYAKKETHFYPSPWNLQTLKNLRDDYYEGREVYVFFTDYDMLLDDEKNIQIKNDLDANFKKVFECSKNKGFSAVYRYN